MNAGTLFLVGCVVATGAIVYQGTMAGPSAATMPGDEVARGTVTRVPTRAATPTPVSHEPEPTPSVVAYPTTVLTIDQIRNLPRPRPPMSTGGATSGGGSVSAPKPPAATPTAATESTPPAGPTPTATAPSNPHPPAEDDWPVPTPTPEPAWPTPTPVPEIEWWDLPTPPPLPPPPDNWAGPRPPSERQ